MFISVKLSLKTFVSLVCRRMRDPPKSPLRRGTLRTPPVPPFLRGARGDLALIVKQQSVTGFNVKFTPMNVLCLYNMVLKEVGIWVFCCLFLM